jgi:hypothetical protein
LNTSHEPAAAAPPATVVCVVAAHAAVRVPVEAVAALRKQPGPPCGKPLPATFLKHADEQTVAGMSAVFHAVATHGLAPDGSTDGFREWGVVAAPRFLGRSAIASDLPRFAAEGAWEVSPHMIPHRSLHSLSGTVSQALKIHGPNFGAGGGPGSEAEGLLAGVALLQGMRLPGVWVVFTRLDPELPDDGTSGRPVPGTFCRGLALALVPVNAAGSIYLELTVGQPGAPPAAAFTIDVLEGLLAQVGTHSSASCAVNAAGRLTLRRGAAPLAGPHFPLLAGERSLQDR